ncbi:WcaF family extracellular polysaccharide biosynthesis acetyltransferase [Rhodobacter lacus]|uniref:WcaF family extracellular polysaccharide biosynthesis acetyltransferase n=1 Tax=Rhodobacter lacus TaxID=1641972 RepID=A0ABW5AC60_9RHOB
MNRYQDLSLFRVPAGFRGRNGGVVQLWWLVQATLFGLSPQFAYRWRRMLLRLFGAQIGTGVIIRPTARITYPWKVEIGDHSWIGDHATLYSLDKIRIGAHCCLSQHSYLATAGHDTRRISFDYVTGPILVEDEVWIASGAFVMPGLRIARGAVIAAGAVLTSEVEEAAIMAGVPARRIGTRARADAGQDTAANGER